MKLLKTIKYNSKNIFFEGFLDGLEKEERYLLFNSNEKHYPNSSFDFLLAIGAENEFIIKEKNDQGLEKLRYFYELKKDWVFGHISYDFKNSLENLNSENSDRINIPVLSFFTPKILIKAKNGVLKLYISSDKSIEIIKKAEELLEYALNFTPKNKIPNSNKSLNVKNRISKNEYLKCFNQIQKEIQKGNIYEINYCQEFYIDEIEANPIDIYLKLNSISPAPFSVFYRQKDHYIMSASPERYLQKIGNKIISQPIKGTAKRHENPELDKNSYENLLKSQKEQAENVMIVDLVRNDLSRTAKTGTVKVEELFGIYSFPQVHQLISTVSSELDSKYDIFDLLKTSFPMGSMTGAPKISAMKIIDKMEAMSRGLYSGTIGYITPDGDADFNVIIRSLIYNQEQKYLSFITGGAITILSEAESEYEECLLKAKGIIESLRV